MTNKEGNIRLLDDKLCETTFSDDVSRPIQRRNNAVLVLVVSLLGSGLICSLLASGLYHLGYLNGKACTISVPGGSAVQVFPQAPVGVRVFMIGQANATDFDAPRLAPRGVLEARTVQSDALSMHNNFRPQYGAAPLTWDNTLASKAQQWANGCKFQHSGGTLGPYGENLAAGAPSQSVDDGIQSWLNEAPQYNPSNPQASHFTQVVWKSTKQLGCAQAQCGNKIFPGFQTSDYLVCEYYPAGNVAGQYAANVGSKQ